MKSLKPLVIAAGLVATSLAGGAALANDRDWPRSRAGESPGYVVVPRHEANVVGYVTAPPAYYYGEPAPRYSYHEPVPRAHYFYQERVPGAVYFYGDPSPFPRSNSKD